MSECNCVHKREEYNISIRKVWIKVFKQRGSLFHHVAILLGKSHLSGTFFLHLEHGEMRVIQLCISGMTCSH